jgi:competence protein ComEA
MSATAPGPERPATSQRAHLLLYVLLGLVLVYVLIARYLRPLVLADPIAVVPSRLEQVEQRLDPNTAPWPELARLPGVGESLARRIVAYREEELKHRPGPIFRRLEDLEPVKGIGPTLLERIGPGLKYPESTPH